MILDIIKELGSTRSRNEKEAILRREVDNNDLQRFFFLSLSPFQNYFMKRKITQTKVGDTNLRMCMDALDANIAKRVLTGNDSFEYITAMINSLSEDDAKIIQLILQADSGCDLGAATINKIWPKLIPTFPVLLATAYDEKLAAKLNWERGVSSEKKSDGGRINIIVDEIGNVSLFSRAGNELNIFGAFDFLGEYFKGFVIDGELLAMEPSGKFASRQFGNGLFTKCVRGTLSENEAKVLHITVWDLIPLEDFKKESCQLDYSFRSKQLAEKLSLFQSTKISLIPSRIIHSISQAQEHYNEMIAAGEEGTMLKQLDMKWENKRSKHILKLKSEDPNSFEVIGYKDGVGKLTGNLGSLEIASSDRLVVASMSGYSLKLRSQIYANLTGNVVSYSMVVDGVNTPYMAQPGECEINLNSIIDCLHNGKIKSKDSDIWSVFLPRFLSYRSDKIEADSLQQIT